MRSLCAWSAPRLGVLLFVTALLLVTHVARAQAVSEEAKAYFKNGVELISQDPPNYQDAYFQFRLAYEKSGSWKVLGNLGLCALKLERDGEAHEYYTTYLEKGGKELDADERATLQRDLLLLEGNSAKAVITSDVPDLEVMDKRAGSPAPPQAYQLRDGRIELRLRAGTHSVTARHGNKTLVWDVALKPGTERTYHFAFAEPGGAPIGGAGPAPVGGGAVPPDSGTGGSGLRTVGFVVGGVGVAALVGGVVTGLMTRSKEDDARSECRGIYCPESTQADFDSAKSLATITNVLFIGGGVLAATGVTLVVVGSGSSERPTARLEVLPVLAPATGGIVARGSF